MRASREGASAGRRLLSRGSDIWSALMEDRDMSRPPGYGIIYNWDGAPHGYSEVPQSMEAFLDKLYAPLEDTQVGCLCWCIGEHAAR